jgi:ABC-type antimicrobial peptide transport system permease subunit
MPFTRFHGGVNSPTIAVQTVVEPTSLMSAAREELRELEPEASVVFSESMRQGLDKQLGKRQAMTAGFGYFALGALLLAVCGVYGVISYATSCRTKEIGLRMALGAAPNQIRGEVMGGGMRWVALGISLGLAGGLALARLLKSVMYGVETADPWTFVTAAVLLIAAAAAANWVPARRASRVQPLEALRYE